jgi:hypothetical protein
MRIGALASGLTAVLAMSFHPRDADAFVHAASSGECEEFAAEPERQLLAAAAATLDPKDDWDKPKRICVQGESLAAMILFVSGQSREPRMQHDVRCHRASRLEAWSCSKVRSDFLLQAKGREVAADPRIALLDARRIVTFFTRYAGPELMLPNCSGGSLSRFTRTTFAKVENIYLDLDDSLHQHVWQ